MNEKEMEGVIARGGTRWALANILLHGGGGKIEPLGARDRTFGANFTAIAEDFARNVDSGHKWVRFFEDWLYAGAGAPCDACKTMMEKMQNRAFVIMEEAILSDRADAKDYQGFKGHQINITAEHKAQLRDVCNSNEFDDHSRYIVNFCRTVMSEDRSKFIIATLTDGTFGPDAMLRRKQSVCNSMLRVCPENRDSNPNPTKCQACTETFMDLEYLVRRDRLDLSRSGLGVKKVWNEKDPLVTFRSRRHITDKLGELCETTIERHPTGRAADIQETCEDIISDYESEIVDTFSGSKVLGYGGATWKICVDLTSSCSAEEFPDVNAHSYHLLPYPATRETKQSLLATESPVSARKEL